ncbi:MAG TPA: DUF4264 family protein [Limnochordia bacterium]|nr:DUF4264 family protein [Limnochordia bacterium]
MTSEKTGLKVIATQGFRLEGEVHKLVTFLNQALKERGLTFGLSKREEELQLTVYQTDDA